MKNLLFSPEQIESKRFFRCDFFIEILFLNKNWTQKLSFWKINFLQKMIIRKILFSKIFCDEKNSIQNLTCWKNSNSKPLFLGKSLLHNLIFFQKNFLSNTDFQWKELLQNRAFWNKQEKWKIGGHLWSKLSQNDFFHIWIFQRNPLSQKLNSKLDFSEYSFSLNYDYSKSFVFDIFRDDKFSIQKLTCWKIINSKSQFLGKTLPHNLILFFQKNFISNTDCRWKSLLQNHAF